MTFLQNWLLSLNSHSKGLECTICSLTHYQWGLFSFIGLIFMENKHPCILICEHLGNSNSCKEDFWRQNAVLQKSHQKLFPLISCEPLRVWWCFICQTKSPNVGIKWLKLYFIPSTYTEMRASESWDSNRGTPCMSRVVAGLRSQYVQFPDIEEGNHIAKSLY